MEDIRPAATSRSVSAIMAAGAMPDERRTQERALIARARDGDLTAFEALYRQNVGRVYALCLRISGEVARAEDITQDVFVRAWQKLAQFRGESAFSTWLHSLALNAALMERRSRRARSAHAFLTDDAAAYERPAGTIDPAGGLDIERAVATLPPGARAVFVLHDVEGYRHEEIARMTGVTVGTSKAQLHRARGILKGRLKP